MPPPGERGAAALARFCAQKSIPSGEMAPLRCTDSDGGFYCPDGSVKLSSERVAVERASESVCDMALGNILSFREDERAELRARVKNLDRENSELRAALSNKQVELRECNHRIVNSLQIAAALMHMEIRTVRDSVSKDILKSAAQRIDAMGRFHRHLTTSDSTLKVDLGDYIATAATEIVASTGIHCDVQVTPELFVDSNIAMNLTIIVNELVMNAKKHAYADKADGRLEVTCLIGGDNRLHLSVTDYGPGLPPNFDPEHSTGLGMSLVKSIVQQLRGEITTENNHGACFKIAVPFHATEGIIQ
jgi:two-component sensor histidine kinase